MPPPSFSVEGWSLAFSVAIFGGIFVCAAVAGLGEYRKLFFAHPREAMSLEVLFQLLCHPASTPAVVCALALIIGLWFLAIGAFIFLALVCDVAWGLWIQFWPNIKGHIPLFGGGV
jgi:hypothetical protein